MTSLSVQAPPVPYSGSASAAYSGTATPPAMQVDIPLADAILTCQQNGYIVTPGALVATSQPFTIKVDFPGYVPPAGKTLKSLAAYGLGTAAFANGVGTHFPFLVTSNNSGSWAGGPVTLSVTATFTDGTTQVLGSVTAQLNATNGSVIPTDGNMYAAGEFYGKGDFDFGGITTDYFYWDASISQYVAKCVTSTGGGGFQPFWPVTPTKGVDTSQFKYLELMLNPSTAKMTWLVGFDADNDVNDGVTIAIGANSQNWGTAAATAAGYGPVAPVVGQYNTYKIPLADFKMPTSQVLKFALGYATNNPIGSSFLVATAKLTTS